MRRTDSLLPLLVIILPLVTRLVPPPDKWGTGAMQVTSESAQVDLPSSWTGHKTPMGHDQLAEVTHVITTTWEAFLSRSAHSDQPVFAKGHEEQINDLAVCEVVEPSRMGFMGYGRGRRDLSMGEDVEVWVLNPG